MKKILAGVLATVITVANVFAGQAVGLRINNRTIESDVPAQIVDGRTLVPLRTLFENMGVKVDWDANTKRITGTRGNIKIEMYVGSTDYIVNGNKRSMDVTPMIIDGRTMIPARYAAEAFDLSVNWDASTKTVNVKSKASTTVATTQATTRSETTTKSIEPATEVTTVKKENTTVKNESTTKSSDKITETTTNKIESVDKSQATTSAAKDDKKESTTKQAEATTETTTMYAPNLCCDIPDVKVSLHKVVLNDIKSAVKGYNIGNAKSLNRLKDTTRKSLIAQWDSSAVSPSEKEFVKQSKLIYQYIVLCYKKIDTRYAKYPNNEDVNLQCKNNKEKLDDYLLSYYQVSSLKEVTEVADNIQKMYKTLPA